MCPVGVAYFCRRILVTLDLSQRIMGSVEDELRWVVAKEALAHVHDGLNGRGLRSLVDDRPDIVDQFNPGSTDKVHVSELRYSIKVYYSPNILPLTGNPGGGFKGFFHHVRCGESSQSNGFTVQKMSRKRMRAYAGSSEQSVHGEIVVQCGLAEGFLAGPFARHVLSRAMSATTVHKPPPYCNINEPIVTQTLMWINGMLRM
jgi:hypothetical protein